MSHVGLAVHIGIYNDIYVDKMMRLHVNHLSALPFFSFSFDISLLMFALKFKLRILSQPDYVRLHPCGIAKNPLNQLLPRSENKSADPAYRAAPGTTLGVEQPTLAAPWPPCCPALLHLAAPLGAPSRPRKLFLRFRSCRLAPSNPCKVSQRLQARVTMQLAYPCWTVATLLPSRAAVWHPQTLARSRSRSKHVPECS